MSLEICSVVFLLGQQAPYPLSNLLRPCFCFIDRKTKMQKDWTTCQHCGAKVCFETNFQQRISLSLTRTTSFLPILSFSPLERTVVLAYISEVWLSHSTECSGETQSQQVTQEKHMHSAPTLQGHNSCLPYKVGTKSPTWNYYFFSLLQVCQVIFL